MFNFNINDVKYSLPEKWQEITLPRYVAYLRLHEDLLSEFDEDVTYSEIFAVYPEYFIKVISFWGIPEEVLKNTDINEVFSLYHVFTNLINKQPDFERKETFEWKGKTYRYPRYAHDFNGSAPMGGEAFGDVTEAMQVRSAFEGIIAGKFDVVPKQIAILCSNTTDHKERVANSKELESITMDIVWEFTFFLTSYMIRSGLILKSYSVEPKASRMSLVGITPFTGSPMEI